MSIAQRAKPDYVWLVVVCAVVELTHRNEQCAKKVRVDDNDLIRYSIWKEIDFNNNGVVCEISVA